MKARKFKWSCPEPAHVKTGRDAQPGAGGSNSADENRAVQNGGTEVKPPAHGGSDKAGEAVQVTRLIRQPFEPKPEQIPVLPKITASTAAPLKVELDRRIKTYALQDINQLLEAEGVDLLDLLPDLRKCNGNGDDETLDLWVFDNDDFECRSWQEWLDLGRQAQHTGPPGDHDEKEGGNHDISVPAMVCQCFQAPGQTPGNVVKYVEASVVGYDKDLGMYEVLMADGEMADGAKNREVLTRPRIFVMFKADDPFMFAKRVAAALRERDRTTRQLVYNLSLDCMPVDFLPAMTDAQAARIVAKAVSTKRLQAEHGDARRGSLAKGGTASAIMEEMNLEYLRALNRCILDQTHARNAALPAADQNHTLSALVRADNAWGQARNGCVPMPAEYDYVSTCNQFTFTSFLTTTEVLRCVNKVQLQSAAIANSSLFAATPSATRPDEFQQMQSSHREKTAVLLREQWLSSLITSVTKSLEPIGKGWFNTREHRMSVYLQTKLCKLMTQIKFVMQDSLRTLAKSSTQQFQDLIVSGLDFDVQVEAFDQVTNTRRVKHDTEPKAARGSRRWQWEKARMAEERARGIDGEHERRAGGLFVIDIVAAPKTNVLQPSFGLEGVETMPLEIYDAAIAVMQGIPELQHLILTAMFWPEKPNLAAPDAKDDEVKARRDAIAGALKAARGPVEAYLDALKPLQDIIQMDSSAVVKEWEDRKPEEIASALQGYQSKKSSMESRIPRNIAVGGFTIGMERVKKLVLSKYTEIIEGLGGAIASATRKRCEAAIKGFDSIISTLKKPPASIEAIAQTREYIKEIPDTLVDLKAEVDSVTKDYDLLDGLYFSYTNADVKQRWHCFGLPHLIHSKIHEALQMLEDKQAEFDKAMRDEQQEFNDDMAALSKMVANYSSRRVEWVVGVGEEGDLVEETAAEVKRTLKRLGEADGLAKKFNSREVLFGLPQTDYSDVMRTQKAFEPYANLWLAMNDFDKKRKIWMTDPFTSLDAEEIEKSVQTWWRTIFKAAKNFEVDQPEVFSMATTVKLDMEGFKSHLPIITALRNPGMRERHWKALSAEINMDLSFGENVTLNTVLDEMKLPQYMDQISNTGDLASKEYLIEKTLLEMKESWNGCDLDLMEYRDTGCHVLRGLDDILQHLGLSLPNRPKTKTHVCCDRCMRVYILSGVSAQRCVHMCIPACMYHV